MSVLSTHTCRQRFASNSQAFKQFHSWFHSHSSTLILSLSFFDSHSFTLILSFPFFHSHSMMSEPRYDTSLPSYDPYSVVESNDYPCKAPIYQELNSQPASQSATRKCGVRRSSRRKGKKEEMTESTESTWTKSHLSNGTKERYEATLNFLQRNNLLEVTMKAVELEKRNVAIKKKMDQLRVESFKYCNA